MKKKIWMHKAKFYIFLFYENTSGDISSIIQQQRKKIMLI
jgi:hypothetical protein